jgi:hypothetical protein
VVKEFLQIKKIGWLSFFILTSFNFGGCAIITTYESYVPPTKQNNTPDFDAFIIPGQTTKEDVLQRLGNPDEVSDDNTRWAYFSFRRKTTEGFIVIPFGVLFPRGSVEMRHYIFSITFDENNNLVSSKGFYERITSDRDFSKNPDDEKLGKGIERIDRYVVKGENQNYKRIVKGKNIAVGPFASSNPGQAEFGCHPSGALKTPDNEPFSMYIRKALIAELIYLGVYFPQAEVTISGNLDRIEYNTTEKKYLGLMITVDSSNGKLLTVWEKYKIPESHILSLHNCQELAKAFLPAVQNLISNLIQSPEFSSLINQPDDSLGK